jgi:hypothetical protein
MIEKGPHGHDGTRTRDPQFGRLTLYPAELRAGSLVVFGPGETLNSELFCPDTRLLRRYAALLRIGNPCQIG